MHTIDLWIWTINALLLKHFIKRKSINKLCIEYAEMIGFDSLLVACYYCYFLWKMRCILIGNRTLFTAYNSLFLDLSLKVVSISHKSPYFRRNFTKQMTIFSFTSIHYHLRSRCVILRTMTFSPLKKCITQRILRRLNCFEVTRALSVPKGASM